MNLEWTCKQLKYMATTTLTASAVQISLLKARYKRIQKQDRTTNDLLFNARISTAISTTTYLPYVQFVSEVLLLKQGGQESYFPPLVHMENSHQN